MVVLYFSGTGNSKYIAELFAGNMGAECHSIEEDVDFGALIARTDTVAFCYPVYGSRVPRIMREFAQCHAAQLEGKKLVVFCTQLFFSGDGARAFVDNFPRGAANVVYAEHFLMPNNICNFFIFPQVTNANIDKCVARAKKKMDTVCKNIHAGVVKRRGFNIGSRALGLFQGVWMPLLERAGAKSVKITGNCTRCRLCVDKCPVHNLECNGDRVLPRGNCIVCCRCVNLCPQKAITASVHAPVKGQYHGVKARRQSR